MISRFRAVYKMTIFDDIDATSFGFQEFLNVFETTSQRFLHDTINKAWVSHYAIITKAFKIRNWVERVASQSSI